MKKLFILFSFSFVCFSCFHFPWDNVIESSEKRSAEFLNAIKEGDILKAKTYCTQKAKDFIDSCIIYRISINLTDVYDIKGTYKEPITTVEFCCLNDSVYNEFRMVRVYKNDCDEYKWMVDDLSGALTKK